MTELQIKELVERLTHLTVAKVETLGTNNFRVYVEGGPMPHDRFNVSNSVPINVYVDLIEGWRGHHPC